jgi:Cft2 family RNA processing exonuclease
MPQVDIILLTHATFRHCGALPYLKKKYDFSNISVYATFPVNKLASTSMYEYYISQKYMQDFDLFSIQDIDEAFEDVHPVNLHQTKTISCKDISFTITALNAGYSLGGAIWVINFMMHKLIYAIDVHDKNESITEPLLISEIRDAHFLVTNTYIAPSIDGINKIPRIQPQLSRERLKFQINHTLLQHLNFEVKVNKVPEGPTGPKDFTQNEMDNVPISEVLMNYGLVGKDTDYNSSEYPCAGQYDAEILI